MTTITKKLEARSPHLTEADVGGSASSSTRSARNVLDDCGERDAAYIRRIVDIQRELERRQPRAPARVCASGRRGSWAPRA